MTIEDREFFASMKELSDTITLKYDQKLDALNTLLQEILKELINKDINCLKNQASCKSTLTGIFVTKNDLPREIETAVRRIEDTRLHNISKFKKLFVDIFEIFKVVAVIVVMFGLGKYVTVLKG